MSIYSRNSILLLVLYLSFVSLGLPDQTLGIAWPTMRMDLQKPLDYAGIIVVITGSLTAVSGFVSGWFIKRFKITIILAVSCFLTAAGIAGYAISFSWEEVLLAAAALGLGAGTIDGALNNYVAQNYGSKHMNWLHGCWGIGATLGPVIMVFSLSYGQSWRNGYAVIAMIQFFLTLVFIFSSGLWKKNIPVVSINNSETVSTRFLSLKTFLSMGIFFIYSAAEFSIGLWFYSVMTEGRHVESASAGSWIALYWLFLTMGRFIVGFISERLGNYKVIMLSLYGALVGCGLLLLDTACTMIIGLCLTGFSFAGIYPSMMHATPKRFGKEMSTFMTGIQSGSASLGIVLLPPLLGVIITATSLEVLVPLLMFLITVMMFLTFFLDKKLK